MIYALNVLASLRLCWLHLNGRSLCLLVLALVASVNTVNIRLPVYRHFGPRTLWTQDTLDLGHFGPRTLRHYLMKNSLASEN